jgi:hypothetical protein
LRNQVSKRLGGRVIDVWMEGPYDDGEWSFQFSDRMHEVQQTLYDIGESMSNSPSRAERKLTRIID